MKKETKLGLFAILILGLSIWGYYYLKGRNLLSRDQVFYVEYQDIGDLMVSSPVKINGFQVGSVVEIALKKEDMSTIVASLHVEKGVSIPKESMAVIEPLGFMGGASIALKFNKPCSDGDCAASGTTLQGKSVSLMSKMFDSDQLDSYVDRVKSEFGEVLETLDSSSLDPTSKDLVGQSLYDTRQILANTRMTTEQLAILVQRISIQLEAVMGDLQGVTSNLNASKKDITTIITNTSEITSQVKDANLGDAINTSKKTLEQVQSSVANLNKVTSELQTVLAKVNQGDGTLGKLINDKELYHNLQRTSRNLDLLLQDVRLNPKRYINVSVIGRSQKDYALPEEDPAFPKKGE